MASDPPGAPLDPTQLTVAEAPPDARQLVIAGAGQGKTEVVASRIAYLVDTEGLSASTDILVLSFSRAAVQAVSTRLADRDGAAVNVRTFDSFASQLLLDCDVEPTGSYAHRIRQATAALIRADDVPGVVADLQHLVIDEVQDLVGDRADFVLAILDNVQPEAGLTVRGDPLQGIYVFVQNESRSKATFNDFYRRLTNDYGLDPVGLAENYRARGADCRRVVDLGTELRSLDDPQAALGAVKAFEEILPRRDRVDDWTFLNEYEGRSAVLCNTNAEVLRVSRALLDQDIHHAVRRPAQSFGAARWLGCGLAPLAGPVVAQSDVEESFESRLPGRLHADDTWHLLKSADGDSRSRHQLNISRLGARVRSGGLPLTLTQGDDASIVVSTVHRAKGLEFDNVFVVATDYQRADDDAWQHVRRSYVALTRVRDHISIVHPVRSWSSIRECMWLPDRLQERAGRKPHTRARAIEFKSSDVYCERPASIADMTAQRIQETLEKTSSGRPVDGELDRDRSDFEFPVYTLKADGVAIGRTTEDFGRDFARLFNIRKPGLWPAEISDLLLVSVETTAGDPRVTEQAGVGPGGFWLVPRVVGMARPQLDVMEEVR